VLSPQAFHELVSGRQRGVRAATCRAFLRAAETPYALAMRLRNLAYDRGWRRVTQVDVPVVSVGNLTLGGTGKTPLVEWLARWWRAHDVRVTIVSRGYAAASGARNDEALELEQKLPDVPHLQDADRVAAALLAIEEFDCELILLDDGFQHRRLARDLDIVLVDALDPFGCGHVFPRGTLREPLSGLRRADVVVLSRADVVAPEKRDRVRERLARYTTEAVWVEVGHRPHRLLAADGGEQPLAAAEGRVAAFCGIGNPEGFRHTLDRAAFDVVAWKTFPDHHAYARDDVRELEQWVKASRADVVLCTHKDLVKLGVTMLANRPLWAVVIGVDLLSGREPLEAMLRQSLPPRPNG
jgi:tetraacyldisaccharide 4'-kinase